VPALDRLEGARVFLPSILPWGDSLNVSSRSNSVSRSVFAAPLFIVSGLETALISFWPDPVASTVTTGSPVEALPLSAFGFRPELLLVRRGGDVRLGAVAFTGAPAISTSPVSANTSSVKEGLLVPVVDGIQGPVSLEFEDAEVEKDCLDWSPGMSEIIVTRTRAKDAFQVTVSAR